MVCRSGNALALVMLAALSLAPGAAAWAWPVDGPVLRPFVAVADPYAGGQHRGIDIGAPTGSEVRSATTGVVAFAGRLPTHGLWLTVRTGDGCSVTLVHLGSIGVSVGTRVSQGDVVGTVGPTGDPEGTAPYVYLGMRRTADPNGYIDPLTLLPSRHPPEQPPPVQPKQQAQPPAAPLPARRSASPGAAGHRGSRPTASRGHGGHRSAAAPVSAAARTHPRSTPRTGTVGRQRAKRSRAAARTVRERASHARPIVTLPRARELRHPPVAVPAVRERLAAERRRPRVVPARPGRSGRTLLIALGVICVVLPAIGFACARLRRLVSARRFAQPPLRKMSSTEPAPEEGLPEPSITAHLRRRRVAVRERPKAPRACRRLRCSVGHHRPVSPAAGRRRPDGQRYRRARHSRDDRLRSRGSVAA